MKNNFLAAQAAFLRFPQVCGVGDMEVVVTRFMTLRNLSFPPVSERGHSCVDY